MIVFRVLTLVLPFTVVLIDAFLILKVESIFKLSQPYILALVANAGLYAYYFEKYYQDYKPQLLLLALLFILFTCSLPRTPSPGFIDRWTIFQCYIGVFLGIGSLLRHRFLQFFFLLYVAVHVVTAVYIIGGHVKNAASMNYWIFVPGLIYFGAFLAEVSKLHASIIQAGGYRNALKQGAISVIEPFRGLGWVEWFGVLIIALSILRIASGTGAMDRLLGSLYRTFVELYKSTIELIPDILVQEFFFFFFNAAPPIWLAPVLIVLGIFLRAADLHSKRYEDSPIWNVIVGKIIYPNCDNEYDFMSASQFSNKPLESAVLIFNFMVVTSILSILGINPIQWLAPNGGASSASIIFVCVAGFFMGALAKGIMDLPPKLDGVSFYLVTYSIIAVRGLYYGPSLIVLSPLVAWRILLISLVICVTLALLSVGVDLVRPELQPFGSH